MNSNIEIFTDGSCHTELKIGSWAAILRIGNKNINIERTAKNTSHNRMELLAALKAFEYLKLTTFIRIKSLSIQIVSMLLIYQTRKTNYPKMIF